MSLIRVRLAVCSTAVNMLLHSSRRTHLTMGRVSGVRALAWECTMEMPLHTLALGIIRRSKVAAICGPRDHRQPSADGIEARLLLSGVTIASQLYTRVANCQIFPDKVERATTSHGSQSTPRFRCNEHQPVLLTGLSRSCESSRIESNPLGRLAMHPPDCLDVATHDDLKVWDKTAPASARGSASMGGSPVSSLPTVGSVGGRGPSSALLRLRISMGVDLQERQSPQTFKR